ncbi:MAG TPA: DNA cytosine methyltransferase [Alphaproteobacteria bacterium]|nr:DNA cytosine methyltransferase [Alphaproteobacteria bacterium]
MGDNIEFTAVDLFAGAGGFSLAAILAGFNVRFAVENDKHASETYKKNICERLSQNRTALYSEDITELSAKKLRLKHFRDTDCDLMLGGPPCQGFSAHRILGSGVDDPRNKLILEYFKFVKVLKPKVFLMENVPGILWPRHQEYLDQFYDQATRSGYNTFPPVTLDARDFGVPQRRKRVFVLGVREDLALAGLDWPLAASHVKPNSKLGKKPTWVNCSSVFWEAPKNDPNDRHMRHTEEIIRAFQNTPKNGGSRKDSGRVLPCHKGHDGHKDVYGRIDPNAPAPTMTTACINPSKGRFVHPEENHGITVRQAARIQTFPDHFIFYGGLIASGKQIGNAVPVKMGNSIVTHIRDFISQNQQESPKVSRTQKKNRSRAA